MGILSRSVGLFSSNRPNITIQQLSTFPRHGGFKVILSRFQNFKEKFIFESILFLRNSILQVDYITSLRSLRSRSRRLAWGATVFGVFDWEKHKVLDDEMIKFSRDLETCQHLTKNTLTCVTCGLRYAIEKRIDDVKYCQCKDAPSSVYGVGKEKGDWVPFLERKDIIVWRKEHPDLKGMYIYKMYGRFDDVSADEYLRVQLDMSEFRLNWDTSTAQCFVLERKAETNQEVYYWEVNWPRFFSNRDYCCVRQYYRDPVSGTTVLISRSTQHTQCPVKRKCLRVEDYNSVLTVKPFTKPDQLGIEFCLTGFENPGVQLPESIITWVAIRGMPEFMLNLRNACIKIRNYEAPTIESQSSSSARSSHSSAAETNNNTYINSSSRIYA
ncbi:uncharacterized protein LOC111704944 isoform X2 [Eurytemora carolleeae]|uniref:uncharacterized protein LOC111704944 isoform X2 n=1 Tax=Eurytemora carolleeae TaxID=1294199 RepID=UPI000C774DE8|nr:uncharacterized protein LOC111704944 isoform X2 [Eurytemora carolleeae]|eukprot:XP_023333112.1 uncharacterized protein LOC111704944 isoform X2 [Eurytemora affinis]